MRRLDSGEPSHSTRASGMFFRRQEDRLNGELQERLQKIRSEENAMDAEFAKVRQSIMAGWKIPRWMEVSSWGNSSI